MPNRLIREGLMEAEAMLSVAVEARWLFVIIMLSADDVGLFEATEFKLARRADVNRDLAGKLMQMLADVDLIRLYSVGSKKYGFIPKFRQRLQIKSTKHPLPPEALMAGDDDAMQKIAAFRRTESGEIAGAFGKGWKELRESVFSRDGYKCIRCESDEKLNAHHLTPQSVGGEHSLSNLTTLCDTCSAWSRNNLERCNEIKDLALSPDAAQMLRRYSTVTGHPSEAEAEEEQRKRISTAAQSRPQRKAVDRVPNCPHEEIVAVYHEVLPEMPRVKLMAPARKAALRNFWKFVLTSPKSDGSVRATSAEQAMRWIRNYFTRARDNDFVMGRTPRSDAHAGWRCDIDFLVSPKGLKQVIEKTAEKA